jgi:hypothetical protein
MDTNLVFRVEMLVQVLLDMSFVRFYSVSPEELRDANELEKYVEENSSGQLSDHDPAFHVLFRFTNILR